MFAQNHVNMLDHCTCYHLTPRFKQGIKLASQNHGLISARLGAYIAEAHKFKGAAKARPSNEEEQGATS